MSSHVSSHSGIRDGRRPGSNGRQVTVTANLFPIVRIPVQTIHHYDAFEKQYSRPRALEIIDKLQIQNARIFNPRAAFDGQKNMFRVTPLDFPAGAANFTVYMGRVERGAPGTVSVTISRVRSIEPSDLLPYLNGKHNGNSSDSDVLMTITVLNVLVRMLPIMTHPSNARAFFTKDIRDFDFGKGLELWRGFFQSVIPSINRPMVNVDTATAVMYQGGSLLSLIRAFLGTRDNRELIPSRVDFVQERKLASFLKKLLVYSTVPPPPPGKRPKVRPIRQIIMSGANTYKFELENRGDGEEMTITEYFKRAHRYTVQLPNIICVGFSRNVVYPIEVLEVQEGQFYKKTLSSTQRARALKFSTQKPQDRLNAIIKSVKILGYPDSDYLRFSGVTIDPRPVAAPGRILPPPKINFGGDMRPTEPNNGAWNLNGKRLFSPSKVASWAVVNFDMQLDPRACETFVRYLKDSCEEIGMLFAKTKPPIIPAKAQGDYESWSKQLENAGFAAVEAFEAETRAHRPTFLLIILPDMATDIRRAVKHWGDCIRGCPTQCIKGSNVARANSQYRTNLALKINVKIGGVNSVPSEAVEAMQWLRKAPTMIVGADVGHPPPEWTQIPSIAGLVSSVDEQASRYVASTHVQETRLETIVDLETMMKNAVDMFHNYQQMVHNRDIYPHRVVFYRDGVPEGEFDNVRKNEISVIKKILAKMPRPHRAPPCQLTFIVVGKNHKRRFFPKQGEGDKSGNCPAGLVVDQHIVHPIIFDFYLQSHGGLLGTSRSAHYSVVEDENGLDADQLQELSYMLCHVYARATRSVSIPAPVYYADLVCARGAFHSRLLHYSDDTVSRTNEESLSDHRRMFLPVAPNMAQTMYFV